MLDLEQEEKLAPRIRTMQIVHGAMVAGCVVFAILAIFLRGTGQFQGAPNPPLMSYLAAGFAGLMAVLHRVGPSLLEKNLFKQNSLIQENVTTTEDLSAPVLDAFCGIYQTKLILGLAMLEGSIFFSLIAYLVEGQAISLIAAGVMVGLMLVLAPTRNKVIMWIVARNAAPS